VSGRERRERLSRARQQRLPRAVSILLFVLLLIAATSILLTVFAGCGNTVAFPRSAAELESAGRNANIYLIDEGARLAAGRTAGDTVYSIQTSLNTSTKTLTGDERVLYTNRSKDPLSEIVFRVYANDPTVRGGGKPVTISGLKADGRTPTCSLDGSILHVALPFRLLPGKRSYLSFQFSEPVPSKAQNDGIYAYEGGTFDLGNFAPGVVMYSNGAWDDRSVPSDGDMLYSDCSYYYVSLDAPEGYVVATTGVQTGTDGNRRIYSAGPVRDFEIQVSNSYRSVARKVGQTTVTSYYMSRQAVEGGAALDYGCAALQQFSAHFGPYPYTRFNICEAPLNDDGMEYTGQVQISSSLYESPKDPDLEYTVAHEVCHQWWAMGVGSDSIGHAWQDESLTSFCESLFALWQHGQAESSSYVNDFADEYVSAREEGTADGIVDQPVSAFEDGDQYTTLVYLKGALFIDALRDLMGEQAFEKSLAQYYRKNVFINASPEEEVAAFQSNSADPASVSALYERWMHGVYGDADIHSRSQ